MAAASATPAKEIMVAGSSPTAGISPSLPADGLRFGAGLFRIAPPSRC
jgi:hypothetical protein